MRARAAVVTLFALLILAAPAAATYQGVRGVNGTTRFNGALATTVKALGADWTREDYIPSLWPNVMQARAQGINVLPILNPGDEFKVKNADLAGSIIFEWKNEPWVLFGQTPAQQKAAAIAYAKSFCSAAKTIHTLRPGTYVLFSTEIAYTPWFRDAISSTSGACLRQQIDGFSFHLYVTGNPALNFERIDRARTEACAYGVCKAYWITEFGWDYATYPDLQAIADAYTWFYSMVATRPWITGTFPYQLVSSYALMERELTFGLSYYGPTGPTPLPAFDAVKAAYSN